MRIGIDVRYLSHGLMGGVHTYIKQFVPEVIAQAPDVQFVLYADTKRPFELTNLPPHATVRYLSWRNGLSSVANDLFMSRELARDRLDVMHFPANYGFGPRGVRTVITLHDALTIMPPQQTLFSGGQRLNARTIGMTLYLYAMSRLSVSQAALLFTVSNYAKQDILRYCRFPADRIIPVPHAPTADMRRETDPQALADVRARHGITHPFVLADALKNPGVMVRAWQHLPAEVRARYRIVFFSRRPDPLPVVEEAVARGDALLLHRPSRADLIALYSMAETFIFPSWFEGFGIPLLEAMTCGAPVIASDRTSLPEVCGDAALIIDAEDDHTLAQYLLRILTNPDEAARIRDRGFARVREFSWQRSATRMLEAYRALASGAPSLKAERSVHVG